jgi:hypothetical protein
MAEIDLSKCQTPADVAKKLKMACRVFRDRANVGQDFTQSPQGNPWRQIAKELDRVVEMIEKQLTHA